MNRRQLISKLALLPIGIPFAASPLSSLASSFDDFVKAQQAGMDQISNDYQAYKDRYLGAFESYKTELEQEWENPEITNQEAWVEYSANLQIKTVVDFSFNEIRITYKTDHPIEMQAEVKQSRLSQDIASLLKRTERQAVINDPINSKLMVGKNTTNLLNEPLLSEMPLLYGSIDNAQEKLASAALIVEENSSMGSLIVVRIPLPKELPFKRAEKYLTSAQQSAEKWNIEPALVMAIAHTESHFNPLARSHVPAFGLMQIVPSSAGKDASKLMYGKARLLTSDELYNPNFNLDTGSAYLSMLHTRYLKGIKNPLSRQYCAIAAYNTGTGNVAKAFIGRASMQRAYSVINQLSPERVFEVLQNDLPYEETRKYLVKVTKQLETYQRLLVI